MQLTKFDRWLKESFIYETHIFILRRPEFKLPSGVKISELDQGASGDYRFRLRIKNNKKADQTLALLKEHQLMCATHVVEGRHWYNKRIAPEGKSFTYQWILRGITSVLILCAAYGVYVLFQNPQLISTIQDTLNELKAGM
ncbi:hypothetical protein JIN77_06460 [Verrucomicrobiaceae bacterium R5-34]|nr:hypothetical protein [Verrucomicrobiaceae bacterium R5-34]